MPADRHSKAKRVPRLRYDFRTAGGSSWRIGAPECLRQSVGLAQAVQGPTAPIQVSYMVSRVVHCDFLILGWVTRLPTCSEAAVSGAVSQTIP